MIPDGETRLFGILADPVAHVRSPTRFTELFARWDFNGIMVAWQVAPADLAQVVQAMRLIKNLAGYCVTIPHKTAIIPLLDAVSDRAALAGAVNAVRRAPDGSLHGDQFDGPGFVAGLREAGHAVAGRSIYIAGAGGAAAGICHALAEAGAARITIHNRRQARAEALTRRLADAFPNVTLMVGRPDPRGHDIVVNATSLGMKASDPLPCSIGDVEAGTVVAEIVMEPRETRFLREARGRDCAIVHGAAMMEAQLPALAAFMGATEPSEASSNPRLPRDP